MNRSNAKRRISKATRCVPLSHLLSAAPVLLALCLLSASGTSRAQSPNDISERDGNFLLQSCSAALRLIDEGRSEDFFDVGMCVGFVRGFHLGHRAAVFENRSRGRKVEFLYCADGATNTQMIRVLVKSLNDRPQVLHLSSDVLMYRSFAAAFPCK